jgi:peptidoglycan/xylan/chitin deacetylase (PgdA/CDA1 family)
MFLRTTTLHSRLFPSLLWRMDAPEIFLTFDDGPHARATPAVLDVLTSHGVPATFFLSGCNIAGRASIVRETVDRGHALGIHAYSHTRMLAVSKQRTVDEIVTTSRLIEDAAGIRTKWFRPPFGMFSWNTIGAARELGCTIVMWSIMTGDFSTRSSEAIVAHTMKGLAPGSIVVMHDNGLTEARIAPLLDTTLHMMKDAGCTFQRLQ